MNELKRIAVFLCVLVTTPMLSQGTIFFNDIVMRCYYIKRLTPSCYFLSFLNKQQYNYKPCNIIKHNKSIQIDSILFSHHKINTCINNMLFYNSLRPLLSLLNEIKDYRYLHDQQLMYELLLLIFTVHKQILLHECEESELSLKAITFNDIIAISNKISQLPIAEILNAIDMLVTELPPFLEKYEFNSKISWKAWVKKYWWVPPVFGAWFTLKILLSLQRPFFVPTYGLSVAPRPSINVQPIITDDPALQEISTF